MATRTTPTDIDPAQVRREAELLRTETLRTMMWSLRKRFSRAN